jgi:hypothetical protein
MNIGEIAADFVWTIITMIFLSLICAPLTYIGWNFVLPDFFVDFDHYFRPINLPTALIVNFILNFLVFFKFQKKDIILANTIEQQEETEEDENSS